MQIEHPFENLSYNFVMNTGPQPCRVLFCGESPGFTEDELGACFQGRTGQELNRFYLPLASLRRQEVRCCNLIPVHPFGDRNPTKAEIDFFEPYLLKELEETQPELIVPMGTFAANYFLPGRDLHTIHGLAHKSSRWPKYTILPSYHPAAGLHQSDTQPLIVYDFQQVSLWLEGKLADRPQDAFPKPAYIELFTADDVYQSLDGTAFVIMGMDTEGYKGNPWGLSFSVESGVAYVIRIASKMALQALGHWLQANSQCKVILHNALHDLPILREMGVAVPYFEDTMVYAYALCLEPQGLKDLAYRHAGMKMKSYEDVTGPAMRKLTAEYLIKVAQGDWGLDPKVPVLESDKEIRYSQPQALHKRALKACNDIYGTYSGPILGEKRGGSAKLKEIGVRVGKVDVEASKDLPKGWTAWACEVPIPIMPQLEKFYGYYIFDLLEPVAPDDPADAVKRWESMCTDLEESVARCEAFLGALPETGLDAIEDQQVAVNYSARDAAATITVYHSLCGRVQAAGLQNLVDLDQSVLPYLDRMRTTGIWVDRDHMVSYGEQLQTEMRQIQTKLETDLGVWLNPSSSKQVGMVVYDMLKCPIEVRTETGLPSTNDKVLEALSVEYPSVKDITEFREIHKLRSTYTEKLPRWTDKYGRVHPNWKYTRVASGRLCVAKGTKIEVLRDAEQFPKGVNIEDVRVGDIAYTYDDANRLTLRPVTWAGRTGQQQQVVRIHWRGTGGHHTGYVDVTPEHQVRLSNGVYRSAKDLNPEDSLAALSRNTNYFGYERLWPTGSPEIPREHRFVYTHTVGPLPVGDWHVHHLNGNKRDNRVANLELLAGGAHVRIHMAEQSIETKRERAKFMHSPEARLVQKLRLPRGSENHMWLGLSKEWMIEVLMNNGGKPTAFRDIHGIDYATAQKYLAMHGIDWKEIKRSLRAGTSSTTNNHKVVRVEYIAAPVDVYDLEIDGTHNFIANEIAVHNSTSDPNLLAIPARSDRGKLIRAGFKPAQGRVYVGVDLSQIEMRILAHYSQDPNLMSIFLKGLDFHETTAAKMWRLTEAEIRADAEQNGSSSMRASGKNVSFGIVYGIGARGLQAQMKSKTKLDWSIEQCEDMISKWLQEAYPRVSWYMEKQKAICRRKGYVESMFGRRRYLPGVNSTIPRLREEAFRQAINHPIQSSAAEVLKVAERNLWINCLPDIWNRGYYCEPILAIHDELCFEVDEAVAESWMQTVKYEMENAVKITVPIKADGHISGVSWRELK